MIGLFVATCRNARIKTKVEDRDRQRAREFIAAMPFNTDFIMREHQHSLLCGAHMKIQLQFSVSGCFILYQQLFFPHFVFMLFKTSPHISVPELQACKLAVM